MVSSNKQNINILVNFRKKLTFLRFFLTGFFLRAPERWGNDEVLTAKSSLVIHLMQNVIVSYSPMIDDLVPAKVSEFSQYHSIICNNKKALPMKRA
ncbi:MULTISPECIES: hypothetical protein [unclassified Paenibacillus]|nr:MULTISPECIES: hypothetical protein [unclassified Paenibacillus]